MITIDLSDICAETANNVSAGLLNKHMILIGHDIDPDVYSNFLNTLRVAKNAIEWKIDFYN